MRIKFLFFLFIVASSCYSQDSILPDKVDSPINFFRLKPLRLYPYNNRVVPFNDPLPLYVQINYEDGKTKQFEYFRLDSTTYLVYEYFRSAKRSSREGLKSGGKMRVTNEIAGISVTKTTSRGGEGNRYYKTIHHYKTMVKEGEWEELEDSVFRHTYWTGNYVNNKRTGLWKRITYGDLVLEEIDYSKDSTIKIFSSNLIYTLPLDSLKAMLAGRWHLNDCDEEKKSKMDYSKCMTYDGEYGDDCNNRIARENYYDFTSVTRFVRQRGDGCNKFRESCTNGQWTISETKGERYINIKFTNGQSWRLKLIYLDYDGNLITERQ